MLIQKDWKGGEGRGEGEDKYVPGRRIIWFVAPALRIAVTAAWTEPAQEARPGTSSTNALISYYLDRLPWNE